MSASFIKAEQPNSAPLKEKELKHQILNEMKDKLNTPVYISYTNKDLSGKVSCKMNVDKDGKITLADVKSPNKNLNEYLIKKISSLNLWTSAEYSGKSYSFLINFKK